MAEQAAPFSAYRTTVRKEWLDYNGHMHDASYGIAFSEANEKLFAALGLSEDYRAAAGASLYTVEYHIRYLAECSLGDALSATTIVVSADEKRVRLYTELVLSEGDAAASAESMYLHVDTRRGVTTALPTDRQHRLQAMLSAHAGLPLPPYLGRGVGAARG
jgi:acyl-CoA thioesterase FadM